MDRVRCFLLTPTHRAKRVLRRYVSSSSESCRLGWCHTADAVVEEVDFPLENGLDGDMTQAWPKDDPRWPARCPCGRPFGPPDAWQHGLIRLYARSDGGGPPVMLSDAPPGAMWYADWLGQDYRGPDGQCLVVNTPGGQWAVDGPPEGKTEGSWTRSGSPPDVTASPSILIRNRDGSERYHGWLRDGWLVRC